MRFWKKKGNREVRDRDFANETVRLDSATFTGCTFRDCEVRYAGGPLYSGANKFIQCSWIFDGAAANVLMFLRDMYQQGGDGSALVEDLFEKIRQGDLRV